MAPATKAIYDFFQASTTHAFYIGIGGRLYQLDGAPQNATYSYATFGFISAADGDTFRETIAESIVQFRIFSIDPSRLACEALLDACEALFNRADICPASGWTGFRMLRENIMYPFKNQKDDWSDYQAMVDFNAKIQKTCKNEVEL